MRSAFRKKLIAKQECKLLITLFINNETESEKGYKYNIDLFFRPDQTELDTFTSLACNLDTGAGSVNRENSFGRSRDALTNSNCIFEPPHFFLVISFYFVSNGHISVINAIFLEFF